MGLGFKYHIATLVAIFFALTVGLVVGSLFVSPQIADTQKKMLVSLREKMDGDVSTLRTQSSRYQGFFLQSTPRLIRDELKGVSIVIVQVGDYPNAVGEVQETLRLAGAQVRCVLRCGKTLAQADDILKTALDSLKQANPNLSVAVDRTHIFNQLTALLSTQAGQKEELVNLLERGDIATIERNTDVTQPPRCVVVVAGTRQEDSERTSLVDIPFLNALQGSGLKVLVCEPEKVTVSDLLTYQGSRLTFPTVDRVDSDMGRCQLIFGLKDLLAPSDSSQEISPTSPRP